MYQYPQSRYQRSHEHQQELRQEVAEERLARQVRQPRARRPRLGVVLYSLAWWRRTEVSVPPHPEQLVQES